jgi:hypothetical protein
MTLISARSEPEASDVETLAWLCRQNIRKFRRLLASEKEEGQRVMLTTLLEWEQEKLKIFLRPSVEPEIREAEQSSPSAPVPLRPTTRRAFPVTPDRASASARDVLAEATRQRTCAADLREMVNQSRELVREARRLLALTAAPVSHTALL